MGLGSGGNGGDRSPGDPDGGNGGTATSNNVYNRKDADDSRRR